MTTTNEKLRNVAEIAAKIMMGEKALHPNQQKLDVHEPEKDELTADDFKKLRAGKKPAEVKKEEVELTQDEAEMLASLSQEEFNSLTEEEQDLFIEYFQPLDEISTGAAKNYLKKAVSSSSKLNQKSAKPGEDAAAKHDYSHENDAYETPQFEKFSKRRTGIRKAITKLASAHPDNKKLATHARQAFNSMHNANYRIGMDGAKEHPKDVAHIKKQHAIIHKAVNAMKESAEQIKEAEIVKTATGMRVYGSSYGDSAKARRDQVKKSIDTAKGPKMKDLSDIETEKTIKKDSKNYIKDTGQKRAYKVHAGRYFSNLDVGLPSKGREEPRYKNESFANILASYNENGLKGLFEALKKNEVIVEEPDNEQFTKEVEAQKAKNAGEGKKAEVAKPAVQAVQNEEYDVLDYNEVNGVRISEIDLEESSDDYEVKQDKKDPDVHHVHYKGKKIGYVYGNKKGMFGHEYHAMGTGDDGYSSKKQAVNAVKADHKYHMSGDYLKERTLTEPEMKKKEEIVKSMKKGMKGFKERYGERAKEVMYATATKRAMGEEVEQIEEGTPEGYQRRDGKLIPKIHPKMTPHEHGYDYTMQTIEDAQSKAEVHRHHRAIQSDNPHPQGSQDNKDWTAGTDKAKADHLKDFS